MRDVGRIESRLRIGETCAVTRGTVIRVKGSALTIKSPKSASGWRTLELPAWMVERLRAGQPMAKPNDWDVVSTSPMGGLPPVGHASGSPHDLRRCRLRLGHLTRVTQDRGDPDGHHRAHCASGPDQLGHAKVSMTQDNYFGRKVARTGAAAVLEIFGATADHPNSGGQPGG